jgi:hypothetical protein
MRVSPPSEAVSPLQAFCERNFVRSGNLHAEDQGVTSADGDFALLPDEALDELDRLAANTTIGLPAGSTFDLHLEAGKPVLDYKGGA